MENKIYIITLIWSHEWFGEGRITKGAYSNKEDAEHEYSELILDAHADLAQVNKADLHEDETIFSDPAFPGYKKIFYIRENKPGSKNWEQIEIEEMEVK